MKKVSHSCILEKMTIREFCTDLSILGDFGTKIQTDCHHDIRLGNTKQGTQFFALCVFGQTNCIP